MERNKKENRKSENDRKSKILIIHSFIRKKEKLKKEKRKKIGNIKERKTKKRKLVALKDGKRRKENW